MDISSLPFNQSIGIKIDGKDIVLTPRREHLNHVGTVHAAVVYGVAEAAAGQCLLLRFPDLSESFVAVLRSSTVKYRHPASMEAEIRGTGFLSEAIATQFIDALQSRGRAMVDVGVSVRQNDREIFTGTFVWFAGRK